MAAPTIKLADSFSPDATDKVSPAACLAFWRLDYPISFERGSFKSVDGAIAADGAQLRGKNPLIVVSDIANLTVSASKANHLQTITATLKNNPRVDFMSEILPGDWVGVWIVNYEDDLKTVLKALRKGDPANWYMSGFKGMGRVSSLFKDMVAEGQRGTISSDYSLTATCFAELDTQIYYEEALAQAGDKNIPTWMAKIGLDLDDLFVSDSKGGPLEDNVHKVIPGLFEIMLGKGAAEAINSGDGNLRTTQGPATQTETAIRDKAEKAAPYAYLVPTAVGRTMNRTSRGGADDKVMAYADIMTLLVGRQEFDADNSVSKGRRFYPSGAGTYNQTYKYTGNVMLGAFIPLQVGFVNTPLWSIAQQFLNPACNEMFTCFKADQEGYIIPTVQVRQIPFTTSRFPGLDSPYGVAEFLDQPRWVMAAHMLKNLRVGRSDATRTNFVRIYGQSQLHAGVSASVQIVENGTINDPIDIQRSGLHPYATVVACETVSQANGNPSHWMKLVADRMMGSHLTLSGSMTSIGIVEPICVGDNLQFQTVVYHIEGVTHTFTMAGDNKYFTTTLALSNGLSSQTDGGEGQSNTGSQQDGEGGPSGQPSRAFKKSGDSILYAGINGTDIRENEGGLKKDSYFNTDVEDDGQGDINGTPVTGDNDGMDF